MASVTVTETLEVNQIEVTTDNPITSVTVADATSIDNVQVVESGSDVTVVVSPNSAGVASINGLTGVVTVQEAITAQGNITVSQALNANNFTQGSLVNNGSFSSYAQNPVFHGYNLTIGGLDSGDNRQGITFASSTPTGQAYLYYNDLNDKLEQSRDGVNWIPIATSTTELAEGTNLYYTDARADARVNAGIAAINYPVDSVNGQTNTVVLDTDDISEGTTNLYFTNARADARVQAGIAAIDYPVDSVNGKTNTVVLSTTDIGEGTNLYYTDARFDSRLALKTTTNLAEGTNLYYTSARANSDFDTRLATKTTDNLNEGSTNQYFTNARARASISVQDQGGDGSLSYDSNSGVITYTGPSATEIRSHFTAGTGVSITDGSIAIGQAVGTTSNVTFNDGVFNGNLTVNGVTTYVNTTDLNIADKTITIAYGQTGTPTQNAGILVDRGDLTASELRWNEGTDKWEQVRAGTATIIPVNTTELAEGTNLYYTTARAISDFDTRLATKSTTDLAEGTNLYYTDARFDSRLATKTTTNLAEGTNLYYTDARSRAAISVNDTGGDGTVSYNSSTGVISYTGPTSADYRLALSAGTGVTYDNSTGVISIGQSVATTADVLFNKVTATKSLAAGAATLGAGGEVTIVSALSATGTVSGTTPTIGVRAENATSGYGAQVLVVDHGQNRSGGGATTAGNPQVNFESTRGTAASPTATGANDTLGVMQWGGHDGTRGLVSAINGGNVQIVNTASETFTNDGTYTTRAGAQTFLRTQPLSLRLTSASRQNIYAQTWSAVTSAPPTQNIIWNSSSMATQYDTAGTAINGHGKQVHAYYHPQFQIYGVPNQSTGNVDNGNLVGTNQITFYTSRQSGWSGRRDLVESGDTLAQINVFGQTTNNSTGTGVQTGTLQWTASENFSGSVRGSQFVVQTGDVGANTLGTRIALDSNSGVITTVKTNFRAASQGTAAYGGEISMKAGILNGANDYAKTTEMSVTALTTDGTRNATYETKTNRFDGNNYSPTQTGDLLGRFTFLGNYSTTSTPASANAAGFVGVRATENWTSTASGARMTFSVNKAGTNDTIDVIEANPVGSILRSDSFTFQTSTSGNIPGGKIEYRRTFGCFHKLADITAPAANTVYEFDWYTDTTAHVNTEGVTVTSGNPTRLNIDTAASYNVFLEMHGVNTDNRDRPAYIWLAKNGTDLSETCVKMTLHKDSETMLAKQWCVDNIAANDYLEVRFAVDNISGISLDYIPSQASPYVRPAVPSATITITPVGA